MTDQPKPGLFSSLSIGRASRLAKSAATAATGPSEPLTHPLLGASTSSLSLPASDTTGPDATAGQAAGHKATGSWSARNPTDLSNLPYKPRQRHGGGMGSSGSATSIFGSAAPGSPNIAPISSASTSPVIPTTVVSAPPTTSTSTSATFALPPSTTETSTQADFSASSSLTTGPASATLTSRLQLQSLKAAAQKIGLGNGSMGMSMIDAIFDKGQQGRGKSGEGGDWGDLLRTLMSGKAILLLPSTPSSSLPMTPQTLRDHIAFISPPMPSASSSYTSKLPGIYVNEDLDNENTHVLVTLSGMIGTLNGTSICFESTVPSESSLMNALRDVTTRQAVLASLRSTQLVTLVSSSSFPNFTISAETASLSFPPPSKNSHSETLEAKDKDKAPAGKLGRINPFASLFGSSTTTADAPLGTSPSRASIEVSSPSRPAGGMSTPERPASPPPLSPDAASPKPSLLTLDQGDAASILSDAGSMLLSHGEGYVVTAYRISRPVRYAETHKTLTKAIRMHIKEVLSGLSEKVIDKSIKLVLANACPSSNPIGDELLKSTKGHAGEGDKIAILDFKDPTLTGERLQDFMEGVYDDLMSALRSEAHDGLKRRSSGNRPWGRTSSSNAVSQAETDLDNSKEKREKDRQNIEDMIEKEASEGTERVEALLCRLLYNRLFSPLESDDARHDEALASRIAALNMLDLSLDHLGLITRPDDEQSPGAIADGLAGIVDQIGDELQKLSGPTFLTPREKAQVLITAHKIVVDGLTKLPDIELRPEGEPYRPAPISEEHGSLTHETDVELSNVRSSSPEHSTPPSYEGLQQRRSAQTSSKVPSPPIADTSDPLAALSDNRTAEEETPTASNQSQEVLTLSAVETPDPAANEESSQLQEAMSDSVMTVIPPPDDKKSHQAAATSSKEADLPPSQAPPKSATSGADLILPIIIYSVVKSNPAQLASQLMFLRRYRSAICLTGEASYAIVNLTAVVEFIEHVDLAELGLGGESDKVMSIDNLSPIGLDYLDDSNADAASIASASSRLRGRVFQVGELAGTAAGSANKVISGVMDSSWSALRGLISTNAGVVSPEAPSGPAAEGSGAEAATRPTLRPRQASTFSLASVTASVASIAAAAAARNRSRASSRASEQVWQGNQELQDVISRPASIRERSKEYVSDSDEGESDDEDTAHQAGDKKPSSKEDAPKERVSLSNRLASIGVLGRLSNPAATVPSSMGSEGDKTVPEDNPTPGGVPLKPANFLSNFTSPRSISSTLSSGTTDKAQGHGRRSSLLGGLEAVRSRSPRGSIASLPLSNNPSGSGSTRGIITEADLPMDKFMNCDVGDIKISEIGLLLRDYRRLGNIVAAMPKQAQTPPL
ncbi:hypothetical protein IAU60_005600 [Kwoniella sp. DSM 27419]